MLAIGSFGYEMKSASFGRFFVSFSVSKLSSDGAESEPASEPAS